MAESWCLRKLGEGSSQFSWPDLYAHEGLDELCLDLDSRYYLRLPHAEMGSDLGLNLGLENRFLHIYIDIIVII